MSRISYANGRYVPHADAVVQIEDRGYQFADGIYEYFAFYNCKILDMDLHLARLERSLAKLSIPQPMSMRALTLVIDELIAKNFRRDGGLYLQVTRGVARRDHPFPANVKPALTMTICAAKTPKAHEISDGVRVITQPEIRWQKCDIKAVALLANVLAKQAASAAKAREAWLYRPDGTVTEGAVSNSYIITNGTLITHPADQFILGGVTRDIVLRLARANGIPVEERPFTLSEAKAADEAFLTSTSANVLPVTQVDDGKIGAGKPGPVTRRLMKLYTDHIFEQTGRQFG